MSNATVENAGTLTLWGLIVIMLVRDFAIPLAKQMLPKYQQAKIDAEKQKLDNEKRWLSLSEKISDALMENVRINTTISERMAGYDMTMRNYAEGHRQIVENQTKLIKGMAVLLDRQITKKRL